MRRSVVLAAVLAGTGLLAACDKPIPEVTLQSGSTSTTVAAQTYCFDQQHCKIRTSGGIGALHVRPDSTILVDVPQSVANHAWAALSGQPAENGTFRTFSATGVNSGLRRNNHVARIHVPDGVSSYYLEIIESRGGRQTANWVARITVDG